MTRASQKQNTNGPNETPEPVEVLPPEGDEPVENAVSSEPEAEVKPKPKRKAVKKAKEEHPPLPDETKPAPDLPEAQERGCGLRYLEHSRR